MHFAGSHLILPTEHSAHLAEPDCDVEFHRTVSWVLYFSLQVYCAGLSGVFAKHGVRYNVYADDTQLYVDAPPNDSATASDRIYRCVMDVTV